MQTERRNLNVIQLPMRAAREARIGRDRETDFRAAFHADDDLSVQMSVRETELLALVAEGLTNKDLAARLYISTDTVRAHLVHIFEKLHVRCRTEAVARYFRSKPEVVSLPPPPY